MHVLLLKQRRWHTIASLVSLEASHGCNTFGTGMKKCSYVPIDVTGIAETRVSKIAEITEPGKVA